MRILQINVADQARGAAQAALRLHDALNALGHSSRMLLGYRYKDLPETDMLPQRDSLWQKGLFRGVHRFETLTGLQYLCQPWRRQFLRHRFTQEAEVVNLHNTHGGFFSHTILPELTRRLPVVWTMHDLWSITGHCGSPYMYGCERWKTGCGSCPALHDHPAIAIDTTALLWRIKSRVYRRSALTFVTPSEWLAAMVRNREVDRLVDLSIDTAQRFALHRGVLHIEGKCTTRGPRVIEVNARMGGGRVAEIVREVWGVDLVEATARAALGLAPNVKASRKPRCTALNVMLAAPRSGRLAALPLPTGPPPGCLSLTIDGAAAIGAQVKGPEDVFVSVLADITLMAKDLRQARAIAATIVEHPPVVEPV